MNKPEYSDLYKFCASLGTILISFGVILPWLFLRESFDSLVSTNDIANLTSTAQMLILYRQRVALWCAQNILFISIVPVISGLFFLIYGIVLWKRKQRIFDRKDTLENEKLELEIKKMSPEQILEKAINEVIEDAQDEHIENEQLSIINKQENSINKYLILEKIVIHKLRECFGYSNVRTRLKIENTEIDMLVRINNNKRAIIEVKKISNSSSYFKRQNDVIELLRKAVINYNKVSTWKNTYGIGILILTGDGLIDWHPEKITSLTIDNIPIKIIVFSENEFKELDRKELRTIISTF